MSLKKLIDILTLLAAASALVIGLGAARAESSADQVLFADCSPEEKPLRLHILAASDDPFDQSVKLAVRDQVVDYLENVVEDCANKEDAMAAIEARLPLIEQLCDASLARSQVSYTAAAKLETADFPSIAYDGTVFAAGEYDALRIVLGEGEGHNWWCVLFPPLCFVDLASTADEEAVIAALAEMDNDDDNGEMEQDQGYKVAWKLADMLRKQ